MNKQIEYEQFEAVDIRVGTVTECHDYSQGKYSTHKLKIDFGAEIGVLKSLARLKPNYDAEELVGQQVCAVVNFPVKQIGPSQSEALTLGFADENDNVVLVRPDKDVPNGGKLH